MYLTTKCRSESRTCMIQMDNRLTPFAWLVHLEGKCLHLKVISHYRGREWEGKQNTWRKSQLPAMQTGFKNKELPETRTKSRASPCSRISDCTIADSLLLRCLASVLWYC